MCLAHEFTGVGDCRESAIADVITQIGRSMGAKYDLSFSSQMDERGRSFDKRFSYSSSGLVPDVDKYIVSYADGVVVVDYPDSLIRKYRRLALGAEVVCRIDSGVQCREMNGVRVVLTEAVVTVQEKNRHAGFLNYYVIKASSGDSYSRSVPIGVELSTNWMWIMDMPSFNEVKDLVYGTDRQVSVTIKGKDEIGRSVYCSFMSSK